MRNTLLLITLANVIVLSACSTTQQFSYGHFDSIYTVQAAGKTPQESDNRAYKKAESVCVKQGLVTNIRETRRVPNNVERISVNGEYVYLAKHYQAHDYMTVMVLNCQPSQSVNQQSKAVAKS